MKAKESKFAAVRLEKSKLIAAIAVLAVAFVVLAAVPAVADDSDATTSAPAAPSNEKKASEVFFDADGTQKSSVPITDNIKVVMDKAIKSDLTITATKAVVVYVVVPSDFKEKTTNDEKPFHGTEGTAITVSVNSNVTLVVDEQRSSVKDKNTFSYVDFKIDGATVYFEQIAGGKSQFFFEGSIFMTGGKLIMHCNGLTPETLNLADRAQINWESCSETEPVFKTLTALPSLTVGTSAFVDDTSSIIIADGMRMQMEQAGTGKFTLKGSFNGEYHIFNAAAGNLTINQGAIFDGKILTVNNGK